MPLYQTPGVYREDVFPEPPPELRTGVPAFLGLAPKGKINDPVRLVLWPQFEEQFGLPDEGGLLADAVRGFFESGGRLCYVVRLDDELSFEEALAAGLQVLESLDTIDLVCAPDIMSLCQQGQLSSEEALELQADVLAHCEKLGDRFAILDSLPDADARKVLEQRHGLKGANGALYFPWVKVPNACRACRGAGKVEDNDPGHPSPDDKPRFKTCEQCKGSGAGFVPPCGHVAGVYARVDERVGVHKAPANEELAGVLDLEVNLTGAQQDPLNEAGVNCLRAFPGRGIRVWGARTLAGQENAEWTYVSVRRLFLTAGRWIERAMAGVVFEPNDVRLWVRLERELSAYFGDLFRRGALMGSTEEEAFYVKCDAETNPSEVREAGLVVTEIGLAPASPNEFVVVRLIHGASGVTIAGPTRLEESV